MKPRILIVDDDAAIRQQLYWMFCDEYEVVTADNLQSAMRRATIYEPNISILDLHLPPVVDSPEGGMRILEYIKGRLPQSKVLVISSAATTEMQKKCYESGADEFLSKPLDIDHLLATIRCCALEYGPSAAC